MRRDAVGFFWNDAPVPKPPKARPVKRAPPERTWERYDYLPGLEEAQKFDVPLITDHELMCEVGGELYFDVEVYTNFFCIGFMSKKTGHVLSFAMSQHHVFDYQRVKFILENFTVIGFNNRSYDATIVAFLFAGATCGQLKEVSDEIIINQANPRDLLKAAKIKAKFNQVDLIEVAPGFTGLKGYGGRMHVPRMQDLPFNPHTVLSLEQMQIVLWYNVNDLVQTWALDHMLEEQQRLRITLSNEIGQDLRSKSDAQIAEAVIGHEIFIRTGKRPERPYVELGTAYRYKTPAWMQFQTPGMQSVLRRVQETLFVVDHTGSIAKPPEIEGLQLQLSDSIYTMGIGGLHSTEKSRCFRSQGGYRIFDVDVESYYPKIILNLGLYPEHLGPIFLDIFGGIVERRVKAKRSGDKVTADSLKITINGAYGKLGSQYSFLYAPNLLVQTTMTGQLAMLMLIEMFEMYGVRVISANTDGSCVYIHEDQVPLFRHIVKLWETKTGFRTEETEYAGLFSKDVNNYIAIKPDGKFKGKGLYANPWHHTTKDRTEQLKKNPATSVCVDAVIELLTKGVPLTTYISACKDFTKFVSVRSVAGGAVKDGEFLGKHVRWYYATGQTTEMVSAKSGNKVPKSDGAKPCMQLPRDFPVDVDHNWYIKEAENILKLVGYFD